MTNYSYFRSTDLSALLTLEQQFTAISRQFLQQLVLSLTGLLGGLMLLAQGAALLLVLGLILTALSVALGLWSGKRYYFEQQYLWLQVNKLAEPTTLRSF